MPWWETIIISWLTVGIPALLAIGWKRGIRPMMIAIGQLLQTDDHLKAHEKESRRRWDDFERRLKRIERKIDLNGHS